jgi:uncharacterized protein
VAARRASSRTEAAASITAPSAATSKWLETPRPSTDRADHRKTGGPLVSWLLVAIVGSVAVAGASQVVTGMGFALIAGPTLILALGHTDGVRLTVALSLVLNVVTLAGSVRSVRWGDAARLFLPAALVVLPALALTARLSSAAVSVSAGVAVLVASALVASGRRARWVNSPGGAIAAGAASGVLNVMSGTSGPPVALLMAHREWTPRVTTATVQAYALPLNVVTLVALGVPARSSALLLWAVGGLLLGAAAAWPLVDRVRPALARTLALALAAFGALLLISRAL